MTSLSVRQGKLNSAVHRQIWPALRLLECTHLQRLLPRAVVDRHLVIDTALLLARTDSGTAVAFWRIAPRVSATASTNASATAMGATSANVNVTASITPTTLWSIEAQGGAPEAQVEHLEGAGQRQGACRPTDDTGGGAHTGAEAGCVFFCLSTKTGNR